MPEAWTRKDERMYEHIKSSHVGFSFMVKDAIRVPWTDQCVRSPARLLRGPLRSGGWQELTNGGAKRNPRGAAGAGG